MAVKRTSHAVYDAQYHLVWAPKYRKGMNEPTRKRVGTLFAQIAQDFGFEINAMEVAIDHVHLFLSFPPKFSIAKVVGIFKSISASVLFKEDPELREQFWSGQFWEDGYFARTVGDEVTATVIKRYITYHRQREKKPRELKLFR
jgi:putative transposase